MSSKTKEISSSIHNYTLHFEDDLSFLHPLMHTAAGLFIIDQKVFQLYPHHFSALENSDNLFLLDAVEEHKTLAYAEHIFDKVISVKPTKKTKIISIGGGVTQDVSGFVASTFYRGLNWTYVPTTLLAQADSCMGSKTSLNYKSYKNILGTFYPPHNVHIATSFTDTLAEEDFYSGMGEVVKLHVMGGQEKFRFLAGMLPQIHQRDVAAILTATRSSLDIKWTYMDGDEFDQGKRNMLNYGHDFGHAIETATQYAIPHGQAVILGMILANDIAVEKKYISESLRAEIDAVFFDLLRTDYKQLNKVDNQAVINAMKQDKKRIGAGLPLIMMNEQFEFFKITDLSEESASSALQKFKNKYCN